MDGTAVENHVDLDEQMLLYSQPKEAVHFYFMTLFQSLLLYVRSAGQSGVKHRLP